VDTSKLSKKEAKYIEKSVDHNSEVFNISIWGSLQTCFGPKGPASGNTDILRY